MVDVGREVWRFSVPVPLLRQGQLQYFAQYHIQTAFDYVSRISIVYNLYYSATYYLTISMGNLCQSLVILMVKPCFLMFRWNLLCFSICIFFRFIYLFHIVVFSCFAISTWNYYLPVLVRMFWSLFR